MQGFLAGLSCNNYYIFPGRKMKGWVRVSGFATLVELTAWYQVNLVSALMFPFQGFILCNRSFIIIQDKQFGLGFRVVKKQEPWLFKDTYVPINSSVSNSQCLFLFFCIYVHQSFQSSQNLGNLEVSKANRVCWVRNSLQTSQKILGAGGTALGLTKLGCVEIKLQLTRRHSPKMLIAQSGNLKFSTLEFSWGFGSPILA
jgi:hypothetical protein